MSAYWDVGMSASKRPCGSVSATPRSGAVFAAAMNGPKPVGNGTRRAESPPTTDKAGQQMTTHFNVPDAQEVTLGAPVVCPVYPGLTVTAIATADGRVSLVLRLGSIRFFVGPSDEAVTRRARLLAAGLGAGGAFTSPVLAVAVVAWVRLCWESLVDQLAEIAASRTLGDL